MTVQCGLHVQNTRQDDKARHLAKLQHLTKCYSGQMVKVGAPIF